MKFGIYYPYWEKEWGGDALAYIGQVKALGFDVLEVAAADFAEKSDEYFVEMKRMAQEAGVTLTAGYGPSPEHNIGSQDPGVVQNALAFYENLFRQMKLAGIGMLGGALYSYWPMESDAGFDKEADLERSIRGMQTLADRAEEYGVTLHMEALNRFEGYLINTCQECLRYVKAVNRPNVKVMLDTFHMNIEEDSLVEAILLAGKELGHFHVGEANRKPPRAGRMPWIEIGKALRQIQYDGCVVMEPFVVPGGSVGRDIRIWRELFSDVSTVMLDKEAEGSLQYLREALTKPD